jgi:membrane protein implicated in regulation of membrane protease activity
MEAEASRAKLADGIVLPSWFTTSIGVAISLQIGTAALGLGDGSPWAWTALAAGLAVFVVVGAVQLARFRRRNGVWLGGLAGRVVLGTGTIASSSYAVALAAAIWAAFADQWLLVAVASLAGGTAYALGGRRWLEAYRTAPEEHGRGESAAWLAVLSLAAVGGLVLLVLER